MSELKVNKLSPESGTTLTLGDAGDTIVNNGTASGFLPTAGSSGNLLTSDGASWTSGAPAAGGAWSVKSSGTVSGASSLEITGITNTIQVRMIDMEFSATDTMTWSTSTDNGSSYLYNSGASGHHMSIYHKYYGSTPTQNVNVGGPGAIQMHYNPSTADIIMDINMPQVTGYTTLHWTLSHFRTDGDGWNAGEYGRSHGTMINHAQRSINAMKFTPYSGTITGSYQVLEMNL